MVSIFANPDFQLAYDSHFGKAILKEMAFLDAVSENESWSNDEEGGHVFATIPGLGRLESGLLGTECAEDNTWMWAWANETVAKEDSGLSDFFLSFLEKEKSIKDLSVDILPTSVVNGETLKTLAIGMIADVSGCVITQYKGGAITAYRLVLNAPLKNITPPISLKRIGRVFSEIMNAPQVANKIQAAYSFMTSIGFEFEEKSDGQGNYLFVFTDSLKREVKLFEKTGPDGVKEISHEIIYTPEDLALEQ